MLQWKGKFWIPFIKQTNNFGSKILFSQSPSMLHCIPFIKQCWLVWVPAFPMRFCEKNIDHLVRIILRKCEKHNKTEPPEIWRCKTSKKLMVYHGISSFLPFKWLLWGTPHFWTNQYIYIYIYIHIHMYIYIHICTYVLLYIYIYNHIYIYVHIYYIYIYIYICTYMIFIFIYP